MIKCKSDLFGDAEEVEVKEWMLETGDTIRVELPKSLDLADEDQRFFSLCRRASRALLESGGQQLARATRRKRPDAIATRTRWKSRD